MKPHVVLAAVTPDELFAWLPDCIGCAREEMALHPLRPRPNAMIPHRVPMHHLYRFTRRVANWCVGVYEVLPEAAPPFGKPLMLLISVVDLNLQPNEVGIMIWCDARFPLYPIEIAWELAERFPYVHGPDLLMDGFSVFGEPTSRHNPVSSVLSPPFSDVSLQQPENPDAHEGQSSSPSAFTASTFRTAGAPPLECNLWLESEIDKLTDPTDYLVLYPQWLQEYIALRGIPPADPRRSFKRAAETILRRKFRR